MQEQFITDMKQFATRSENVMDCGEIDWNYVDSDMYAKWSVLLDGATYTTMFDEAADIIDGKDERLVEMDDGA